MSASCQRCESLPVVVSSDGILHVRVPLTHTLGKVLTCLAGLSVDYVQERGVISIPLSASRLLPLVLDLLRVLTSMEAQDTNALFEPDGQNLTMHDYLEVCSLQTFAARLQSGWLTALIQEERLTSFFQPIVYSHHSDRVFAYEALLRGREGTSIVSPGRILDVARGAGLLFQLDLAARRCAIREAAQQGITTHLFINFTPTAIYDPNFCLRSTIDLIDSVNIQRQHVVFEVVESDYVEDSRHLKRILQFYREKGFRVALDDLGAGYSSLNMLHELRPDFVKLDMALIRNVHLDPFKGVMVAKLIEAARELGIYVIGEGVEVEGEYLWLRDRGVDFQQGYLFARPAPTLQQPACVLSRQEPELRISASGGA